jgi:hypothetical protein
MLSAISNALNFSFEIFNAPDQDFGRVLANDTWSGGNTRELIEGRADMNVGCINLGSEANQVRFRCFVSCIMKLEQEIK